MKVYRKSDNKQIEVNMLYIKGVFAGYIELQPNGIKRFYQPSSIIIKEYYGG